MMPRFSVNVRALFAFLTLLAAVAFVLVGVGGWLYHIKDRYDAERESIEPRYARMLGIIEAADEIRDADALMHSRLSQVVHPAPEGVDRLGAALQQQVRSGLEANGVEVVSSQILTPRSEDRLGEVVVNLNINASMQALQAGLLWVSEQKPRVFLQSVQLQRMQQRRGDPNQQLVTAQLRLVGLYQVGGQ